MCVPFSFVTTLFAKSRVLSYLRLRAGARGVRAFALILALALVASGYFTVTMPIATATPLPARVAESGGHCAEHAMPMSSDATQVGIHTHAGDCCGAVCACACAGTSALVGVSLLMLSAPVPAARTRARGQRLFRAAPAAPPLRPPIA